MFTGGGTGSGKSTVAGIYKGREDYAVIVDSTLSSEYWSTYQIDKALEEGYDVQIQYVYRDPVDAWENGVWKRYEEGGHFVPVENFLNTHRLSRENVLRLAEKYGDKISISVFENKTGENPKEISLDKLAGQAYNLNSAVTEQINEISRQKIKQHPHLKEAEGIFAPEADNSVGSQSSERRKPEISQRAASQKQEVADFELQNPAAGKNLKSNQTTIPDKAQTEALARDVYPRMLEKEKNEAGLNKPQRKAARIVAKKRQIGEFVNETLADPQKVDRLVYHVISADEAEVIELMTGLETEGFEAVIQTDSIRHTLGGHWDAGKEAERGQVPVTKEHFKLLPEIISYPDNVETSKNSQRRRTIIFEKETPEGDIAIIVKLVGKKNKQLVLKTMWIKKGSAELNDPARQSPEPTS